MPRYPRGAVIPTGTGFTHITSGAQDVAALSEIPASASPELVQLIQQTHPTLQVLAAMDEATYASIVKSGTDYILRDGYNYTTWDELDPNSEITVTSTKVTATGLNRTGLANVSTTFNGSADFSFEFIYFLSAYGGLNFGMASGVGDVVTDFYKGAGVTSLVMWPNGLTAVYFSKWAASTETRATGNITTVASTPYYCTLARSGTTCTLSMFTDAARTTHATGSPLSFTEAVTTNYTKLALAWTSNDGNVGDSGYLEDDTGKTAGNIYSNAISADSAVLSFFDVLKNNVANGTSSHATPVQAELYGDADSYAAALHSTKFTINSADPRIILKRDALDTITASSNTQTVWNMTVAGGMPALPDHGSILATLIGVASILVVEKSVLGNWTDTVVLTENTDYIIDYSTRTATKITLTSGTGIVNAQSKLRISWIADVMKIDGVTNNTALKCKIYLNRTATAETSPSIQLIPLGSAKYVEMLYGT